VRFALGLGRRLRLRDLEAFEVGQPDRQLACDAFARVPVVPERATSEVHSGAAG
jgi:hypothetical protein